MLQDTWSALDALDISLLVVDAELNPVYLTTAGARMLRVKARQELNAETETLTPLISLVKQAKQRGKRGVETHRSSHITLSYQEINLTTTDGHSFLALAYCRELNRPGRVVKEPISEGTEPETYGVLFYSLNALQPYFDLLEHSRRVRALGISYGCQMAARTLPKRVSGAGVDLLAVVTAAVGVVDPLIPSSVKVSTEIQTTALLDIDEEILMRVLSHLLIEASDYIGVSGRVKISAQLVPGAKSDLPGEVTGLEPDTSAPMRMEITVMASREIEVSQELSPLERYLYKSCLPRQHKVSVAEYPDSNDHSTTAKGSLSALVATGSQSAPESHSENIRVATELAEPTAIKLHLKTVRSGLLGLYCTIPLSQHSPH